MERVVGERLRFFRLLNNMNRGQLAMRLGVTAQHVGLIERGRGYPSVELLVKAAEALGTGVANFFLSPESGSEALAMDTEEGSIALSAGRADVQLVAGLGTWDFNFATGREAWSEALRRLLGFPDRKTTLREVLLKRLAPEFAQRFKAFWNKVLEHGRPHPFPCVVISENGTERRLLIHAEQIVDGCHGMDRARLTILDVTDWELYRDLLLRDLNRLEVAVMERDHSLRQAAEEARNARALSAATQRELEFKGEQVERLIQAAPAILYSFVPGVGGTEVWSPHTQHILGYTVGELMSDPMLWNRSIHPEDAAKAEAAIESAMQGHPIDLEYRIQAKDGTWRWLRDQARLAKDASDSPVLIGMAMDISEHKRLEESLRTSEEKFRALVEQSPDMLFLHDLQGNIVDVNRACEVNTGYSRTELLNMTVFELHPNQLDLDSILDKWGDWLPWQSQILQVEHKCKDGAVVPAQVIAGRVRFGNVDHILATARHKSEQQHSDDALRASREALLQQREERFRALFDNSSEGIFLHDLEGRILEANKAVLDMFGYTLDELRRLHPMQLVHPVEVNHVAALFQEIQLHRTTTAVHRCLRKDGTEFFAQVRAKLIGGNMIQGMLRDVTVEHRKEKELIQAMEAAEALSRAKSEFLGNMSHELRTPLNGILGMMHVLKSTHLDEEQQHLLSMALKSSDRLGRLLTDLLELSRLEMEAETISVEIFALSELCAFVTDLFGSVAQEKGLALECVVDPSAPSFLLGDPRRIRQILFQLTGNALKFTDKGGVRLEMTRLPSPRSKECRVLFSVVDTGIGIPGEKLNKIFDSFAQADGSLARPYEGAGLGLAIVKRLVNLMKGGIAVDETPGGGTTIHMTLPLGLPEREDA
ncbi:PAS domain S-box protein [Desulfonatronum thioautotrophicum]|uniref:PAS domain S-box protein n=1 Tax=Desulfonatronum thioautotrophicum TaxID=617001 RepID=UPI000699C62C|nr:PAS domain S-box protein [Desulfonatronum thioautotrophicum]